MQNHSNGAASALQRALAGGVWFEHIPQSRKPLCHNVTNSTARRPGGSLDLHRAKQLGIPEHEPEESVHTVHSGASSVPLRRTHSSFNLHSSLNEVPFPPDAALKRRGTTKKLCTQVADDYPPPPTFSEHESAAQLRFGRQRTPARSRKAKRRKLPDVETSLELQRRESLIRRLLRGCRSADTSKPEDDYQCFLCGKVFLGDVFTSAEQRTRTRAACQRCCEVHSCETGDCVRKSEKKSPNENELKSNEKCSLQTI